MESISVSELRSTLSARLRQVQAGASLLIVHRGRPVARLVPVRDAEADLVELERAGLVRIGSGAVDQGFWDLPAPADPSGAVADRLQAEREEGW